MVAVGLPHHVTQRGNARQDVFVSDPLRRAYLELLREHAGRNQLRILAYCLMTNHLHLVVVLEAGKAMANAFRHAHARFAQDWNTEFHTDEHLWQNRYYSCPVEERAVGRVICYVTRCGRGWWGKPGTSMIGKSQGENGGFPFVAVGRRGLAGKLSALGRRSAPSCPV